MNTSELSEKQRQEISGVLERLNRSAFRRRFKLKGKELAYLREKQMKTVMRHAADFIHKRLAPARELNSQEKEYILRVIRIWLERSY